MDRESILIRVRTVVAEIADLADSDVREAQQLEPDLGMDSFDRVELLNSLEDEFAVTFHHPADRELTTPATAVRDLIDAVQRLHTGVT
jgi:acyl carrier protein